MRKTVFLFWLYCWPALLLAQPAPVWQKADSIAGLFSGHSLEYPARLVHGLTRDLPDEKTKFRAIYTWVCTNIRNDYAMFARHRKKMLRWQDQPEKLAEWQRAFAPVMFRKLREDKATLCSGYAWLLREMAGHAGIRVEVIHGYGRTASANVNGEAFINHSWNAVRLDGRWYLCDPTWSSGYIRNGNFVPEYDDAYFLADPALFILNHYPEEKEWTLLENTPPLSAFLNGPVFYKAAYRFNFRPVRPDAMPVAIAKGTPWNLQFAARPTLENVTLHITKGTYTRNIQPGLDYQNGAYHITHSFPARGSYDVHLLLENTVVATFPIEVSRD